MEALDSLMTNGSVMGLLLLSVKNSKLFSKIIVSAMLEIAGISILPIIGDSYTFDSSVIFIFSFDLSTESL